MTRNVMLTEDFLIRQINIYLAAIGRILGFKTAYMYIEAQIAVDEALEEIFGLPANIVRQMDDPALLEAATHLEVLNLDKLQAAAEVFRQEGELYEMRGQPEQADAAYRRALNFYLDVALNGNAWNWPPPDEHIEKLIGKLAGSEFDPDTLYGLYLYAEPRQQFARAEWLLDHLAHFPDLEEEVRRLRGDFYARLQGVSDGILQANGLTRQYVGEMSAQYPPLGDEQ